LYASIALRFLKIYLGSALFGHESRRFHQFQKGRKNRQVWVSDKAIVFLDASVAVPLFRTVFLYFDNNTHFVFKSMHINNILSGNFLYSDIAESSITYP